MLNFWALALTDVDRLLAVAIRVRAAVCDHLAYKVMTSCVLVQVVGGRS